MYYRAFDSGFAGGAQLEIGLSGKLGFSVGTLYTHGFRNIIDSMWIAERARPWFFVRTRTLTLRNGLSYSIS
jgi:hypothetical protein